jgi:hypothetical protein
MHILGMCSTTEPYCQPNVSNCPFSLALAGKSLPIFQIKEEDRDENEHGFNDLSSVLKGHWKKFD